VPGHYIPPQPPTSGGSGGGPGTGTPPPTTGGGSTPPPADVTAPSVKIVAPGRNARLRKRATVRANATDTAGVEVIEFWVDNVRLASRRGGTLNLRWNLKRVRPGRHKVTILARDAAGNTTKRSVTVRVRR
jgi:hypothetical protein